MSQGESTVQLPRIAIRFCTQCKWNLRAAYYAQELLQTFCDTIGEVALIPVTGGNFTVTLTTTFSGAASSTQISDDVTAGPGSRIVDRLIWDRKAEGGFPETKELKNRVRNVIQPERDLGHIDRSLKKTKLEGENHVRSSSQTDVTTTDPSSKQPDEKDCADCP